MHPPRHPAFTALAATVALAGSVHAAGPGLHPDVHYDATRNTLTVVGCGYAAVNSALQNVSNGGTVEIGEGHCDWGENDPAHPGSDPQWVVASIAGKNIKVRGAGVDKTTLHRISPIRGGDEPLLYFGCGSGATIEISHIHFVGNDDEQEGDPVMREADQDSGIQLQGRCQNIKLHDMVFEKFSNAGMMLTGRTAEQDGVVYDNKFISNYKCYPLDQPDESYRCLGYGVALLGANNWPALQLGGANAIFIENNKFYDNRHAIAANMGARYVVRYNRILGSERTAPWGMLDAHGYRLERNGPVRGTRSWEIYHNTLGSEASGSRKASGFVPRGGDGVFFANHIQGRISTTALLLIEDYLTECDPDVVHPPNPRQFFPDQTTEAWFWGNIHAPESHNLFPGNPPPLQYFITASGSNDCSYFLREGGPGDPPDSWEYTQAAKPGYAPYTYPHPLRQAGDRIFQDDFDWL